MMKMKVLALCSQKGGVGKTTLCGHLGVEAEIKGHGPVALIDTDPQGSLGRWFIERVERYGEDDDLEFSTSSAWGASYESA